jgi:hypothetical protein
MEQQYTFCDECNGWRENPHMTDRVSPEVAFEVARLEGGKSTIIVGDPMRPYNDGKVEISRGVFKGNRRQAARFGWRMDDNLDYCSVCVAEENVEERFLESVGHEQTNGSNVLTDFLTRGEASQVQAMVMLKLDSEEKFKDFQDTHLANAKDIELDNAHAPKKAPHIKVDDIVTTIDDVPGLVEAIETIIKNDEPQA